MVNEILKLKDADYTEIIEKASKKLGISVSSFLRMSAIEKANNILHSNYGVETV